MYMFVRITEKRSALKFWTLLKNTGLLKNTSILKMTHLKIELKKKTFIWRMNAVLTKILLMVENLEL